MNSTMSSWGTSGGEKRGGCLVPACHGQLGPRPTSSDLVVELKPGRGRGLLLVSSEGQVGPTATANLHQYEGLRIALDSHDHHGRLLAHVTDGRGGLNNTSS